MCPSAIGDTYEWATLFSCSPSIWSLPRYVVDGTKLNVAGWRGVVASPTTSRLLLLFLIGKRRTRTEMIAPPTRLGREQRERRISTNSDHRWFRSLSRFALFLFPFSGTYPLRESFRPWVHLSCLFLCLHAYSISD